MEGNSVPWISYKIERGPVRGPLGKQIGMRVNVRVRPEVEEFMRAMSNARSTAVEALGDGWLPIGEEEPLSVYQIELPNGSSYVLNAVAQPLLIDRSKENRLVQAVGNRIYDGTHTINLSFLCLCGLSKEEGVTFGVTGVYSASYIQDLHQGLRKELNQFLRDHIVPVTVNLHIIDR